MTKVFFKLLQNLQFKSCVYMILSFMVCIHISGTTKPKNHSRRTAMTDYDKGRIDSYYDMELNSMNISRKVDWPAFTIWNYLQKRRTCGYQNLPHSGCPSKISDRSFCILKHYIRRNTRYNYTTVQANTLFNVSIQTIQQKLYKELNMCKWLTKNRPKLTKEHAKQRFEWARKFKN